MKNKLILLFVLMILLIPNIVKADEYKNIKISAVFTTPADVSDIDKIYVQFYTQSLGERKTNDVTLLREKNFYTNLVLETGVLEADFIYGYCITFDNIPDRYGLLPITSTRTFEDDAINIVLKIGLNTMNFDGRRYRQNTDLTQDDIDKIKNGVKTDDNLFAGNTTTTTSSDNNETVTTVQGEVSDNGSIIIGTTTSSTTSTTVVKDKDNTTKKDKEEHKKESLNKLIIILSVIGIIVLIFVVVTIVKMSRASKMV